MSYMSLNVVSIQIKKQMLKNSLRGSEILKTYVHMEAHQT
ncbi:Uncharacterised protein [Klebsiella pneumoniae]|nr:Uncharacterised protein [Klebsiella pneumoniae]